MNPFIDIYAQGGWEGSGSGPGSDPLYASHYCTFLEHFIRYNRIRSVVDFGCGDWAFSRSVNWQNVDYLGLDCVPTLITRNRALFEKGNIRFRLIDFDDATIPACDLLIVKDVLQHWSNQRVTEFLAEIKHIPFVLLTNDFAHGDNIDIRDGEHRRLDLTKPPFSENGAVVFGFGHPRDDKIVFLLFNRLA